MEVSPSGRSIIVDRGSFDGIKVGDMGRFLIQSGTMAKPQLGQVARAEAVKVLDDRSYWYLYDLFNRKPIEKDGNLLFALAPDLASGRRPFKTLKTLKAKDPTSVVTAADAVPGEVRPEVESMKNNFIEQILIDDNQIPLDHDIRTVEVNPWTKAENPEFVEAFTEQMEAIDLDQLESVVETSQLRDREVIKIADAIIDGTETKINGLTEGLPGLYAEQARDDNREFQRRISLNSVYDQAKEDSRKAELIHPRVAKKIQAGGQFWSVDMTDDQLRRYFVQSGLEAEHQRIELGLKTKPAHEILIRLNYGLTANTSSDDPNNQAPGSTANIAYEWHLMKTSPNLINWTIDLGFEYGQGRYDLGGTNVRTSESGFRLGFNYYFVNHPSTVKRYVWYTGTSFKYSSATVTAQSLSKEYDYTLMGFPSAYLGVKYRWRTGDERSHFYNLGFGWVAQLTYENYLLSTNNELSDNISGSNQFSDLKFSVGLSIFI